MFKKIFGRKNSIQRKIITTSVIYILIAIIITLVFFYIFVYKSVSMELIKINVKSKNLTNMFNRTIGITIMSVIIVAIFLILYILKKMLKPINEITEATKEVASGDFTMQLQTNRQDEIRRINK